TLALESANHRLTETEAARSLALAAGSMGSWEYDVASDNWSWDAGMRQIFGVGEKFEPSRDEMMRRSDGKDVARPRRSIEALPSRNTTCQTEIRVVRDNGEVRCCQATTAASLDAQNRPVRFSGVLADITERKEAETMQILLAREVDHRARNALAVVQA